MRRRTAPTRAAIRSSTRASSGASSRAAIRSSTRASSRTSSRPSPTLSDEQVQAMLDGLPIANLPDAYQSVVPVLAAARRLPEEIEPGDESAARANFVAACPRAMGPARRGARLGARIGIVSTIAVLTSGASAAAATGSLPPAVQRDAAHWLSHTGIHVPSPGGTRNGAKGGPRGAEVPDPARFSGAPAASTTTSTPALPGSAAPTTRKDTDAASRPPDGLPTARLPTTARRPWSATTVPDTTPASTSPTSTTAPVTTTTTTPASTTTSLPPPGSTTTAP